MAALARRRGPETREVRVAPTTRTPTKYLSTSNTADSATNLRLQRLFGIGIIGGHADLVAQLAWGETR